MRSIIVAIMAIAIGCTEFEGAMGVVSVHADERTGDQLRHMEGTGFVLGGDTVVTAWHVAMGQDTVTIRPYGDDYEITGHLIRDASSDVNDIAMYRIPEGYIESMELCSSEAYTGGVTMHKFSDPPLLSYQGKIASVYTTELHVAPAVSVFAGTSGGPMVLNRGDCIVGMVIRRNPEDGNIIGLKASVIADHYKDARR